MKSTIQGLGESLVQTVSKKYEQIRAQQKADVRTLYSIDPFIQETLLPINHCSFPLFVECCKQEGHFELIRRKHGRQGFHEKSQSTQSRRQWRSTRMTSYPTLNAGRFLCWLLPYLGIGFFRWLGHHWFLACTINNYSLSSQIMFLIRVNNN